MDPTESLNSDGISMMKHSHYGIKIRITQQNKRVFYFKSTLREVESTILRLVEAS